MIGTRLHPWLLGAEILCAGLLLAPPARAAHLFDLTQPDIQSFIATAAEQPPLTRAGVTRILRHAHVQPSVISRIASPAESVLPWWRYRAIFLTDKRIATGVRFWLSHREVLESVAQEQGVAPEYIVAILGCETSYGSSIGKDKVLDTLTTLAFDYPPRSAFFRDELLQFLLLGSEEHLNVRGVKGSYTGAMGAPQFMPSSYRHYGVDEDHNGRVDLWDSWSDIFASVANLLKQNGWQTGAAVLAQAQLAPGATQPVPPRMLDLNETLDSLKALGVSTDSGLPGSTPAVLLAADEATGPALRVGFKNFYAISRYNRSALYAMAVDDLAHAIAAGVRNAPPG